MVTICYRSLVKLRQESQIPPPIWRGPSRKENSPAHPIDTPLHIQLPKKVTDSDKLVHISHPARGDSDSGEHSPADSKGADIHPGPALRKANSLEHIDIEARRGPASREHSPAKLSRDIDDSITHSCTHRTAHKSNPASRGPASREHSTANPSGLSKPSGKTEGVFSKGLHPPRHTSDHPPTTPPRPTPHVKLERLDSKLTPLQKR